METNGSSNTTTLSTANFEMTNYNNYPQLISGNSFELNTAASLSDDSGFAHSISSGSSRACRENENLSDAEVSQFDSLDNCSSDGGHSAKNFNTILKKAPTFIDPPPEFQDSPKTTLARAPYIQSYAQRLTKSIISKAVSMHCRNMAKVEKLEKARAERKTKIDTEYLKKKFLTNNYNIYGSDSFLNNFNKVKNNNQFKNSNSNLNVDTDAENIYDEPNTEYDVIYKDNKDVVLCTKRIIRSYDKKSLERASHIYNNCGLYSTPDEDKMEIRKPTPVTPNPNSDSFQKKFDKFLRSKFLTTSLATPTTTTSSILYSPIHHNHHYHCYYYNHATGSKGSNLSSAANRPNSRNSLNSRLSSSHNSLTVPANKADDSIFITQAMSHDALLGGHNEITDFYNVPFDSDIYATPVDVINEPQYTPKKLKARNLISLSDNNLLNSKSHKHYRSKSKTRNKRKKRIETPQSNDPQSSKSKIIRTKSKRLSVPENNNNNSVHLTLDEVKKYYNNLYSTSSDSSENKGGASFRKTTKSKITTSVAPTVQKSKTPKKKPFVKDQSGSLGAIKTESITTLNSKSDGNNNKYGVTKKSQFSINLNLKQKFCSIFRFRKHHVVSQQDSDYGIENANTVSDKKVNLSNRALPPLPPAKANVEQIQEEEDKTLEIGKRESTMDFAANIEKVKEFGWYWGSISSEGAEKILSNEPDGSFIVRDSSDDHYIFSLTFKLNGSVRNTRIEHDQGSFSFGSCAKFKSRTIVEFIENAVEHSRSGRYLFFLHRRPEHGPMRVQLTNPVSRFKHIQSLQHMCRFVILKAVMRKDLIETLPLPRRILDYLSNKNCLSEQIESDSSSQVYGENTNNINSNTNTITRL